MKSARIILVALCLLTGITGVQAQVGAHRNDLAVGVTAGYVLSRPDFYPTIKLNQKGGEILGLTVRYTCEKYFSAYCAI